MEEILLSENNCVYFHCLRYIHHVRVQLLLKTFSQFNTSETLSGYHPVFIYNFPYDQVDIDNDCLNVAFYVPVAGYVAKKTASPIDCKDCCATIVDKKKKLEANVNADLLLYFDN